jgi:hypothetical protein
MAMEHTYTATRTIELVDGEKLKINGGEIEMLKETVPNNKKWAVTVKVEVNEYDADAE